MAACSLFEEDEVYVYKPGKGYSFGLVVENSEFLSSGDEDEADAENDKLLKGTVRVSWHPTGKETVVAEDKVQLLDRSLMPGDVVKRLIPGQESQCGFVMNTFVRCHLRVLGTNKYIYNVNSKELTPVQKFEYGQEVMLDSWLGRIESFDIQVVLLFADGARCQVDENDLCLFRDVWEKRNGGEFSACPYYPGQELRGHLDCLSDAKWLHSTSRYNHKLANKKGKSYTIYVKVDKIVYKNVEIHWLSRGFEKGDNVNEAFNPPPSVIEGDTVEKLKILDWFSHCSVQIGDHMSYRIKNGDCISLVEPAKAYDPKTAFMKDALIIVQREAEDKKQEEPLVNSDASGTSIDKEVDDGDDADFEDIDDGDKPGEHEKNCVHAGDRCACNIRDKKKKRGGIKSLIQRYKSGKPSQNLKLSNKKKVVPKEQSLKPDDIVQVKMEFTTSWASVMWQDGTVERDIPSLELFPVHHLDDLEFFPGDFIISAVDLPEPADYGVVVKVDHVDRTCLVHWIKAYEIGKATAPTVVATCEVSVYDITDHPDYKFRPGQNIMRVGGFEHLTSGPEDILQAVGQIFEMDPNGHLIVKWANGNISQCYPQEVYIFSGGLDDLSDNSSWGSESDYETDGSGETWETESENEIIGEGSEDRDGKDDGGAVCEHKQELDALLSRAESALSRLQKLLNVFDFSNVSVPDCFYDIIRIYRNCHDLDKILQSSFFVDPELQSLISQAKKELRREKAIRLSKRLSLFFEAWSNSLPHEDVENAGTVALNEKDVVVGVDIQRKGADIEVSFQVPTIDRDNCDASISLMNSGAAGGSYISESVNTSVLIHDYLGVSDRATESSHDDPLDKGLKETSDQSTTEDSRREISDRRPSDPSNYSSALGTKNKKKNKDLNLVGDSCVTKAAKRTKSDGCVDSGHEAKKSKDETTPNTIAQDLCYKICQSLQKQILKIHEEVNKRTKRLMNAAGKQDNVANESCVMGDVVPATSPPSSNPIDQTRGTDVSASQEFGEVYREKQPEKLDEAKPITETPDSAPSLSSCEEKPADNEQNDPKNPDIIKKAVTTEKADKQAPDAGNKEDSEVHNSNSSSFQKEETNATIEDVKAAQVPCKGFDMFGEVPLFHTFVSRQSQPANLRVFRTAVRKELKLFQSSLADGIFVKGFEDRMDLYSFMILGPVGTPYEDALFLFDMMLPNDYPNAPPLCHYHSYCTDRLNPNLYEDGKVCVSLLGTWSGKGTEVWTSKSNLLQVLISIQGLILVPEPYYNEAGYERQRGTQVGLENSRLYNEMVILKTVQSLTKMCQKLSTLFKEEIYKYLKVYGPRMISRLTYWMQLNELKKKQPTDCASKDSPNQERELQPKTSDVLHQEPLQNGLNSQTIQSSASINKIVPNVLDESNISEDSLQKTAEESITQNTTEAFMNHQHRDTNQAVSAVGNAASADPVLEVPMKDHPSKCTFNTAEISEQNISKLDDCSPLIELSLPEPSSKGTPVDVSLDLQGDSLPGGQSLKENTKEDKDISPSLGSQKSQVYNEPEYPLFPMSRGFCLTLQKYLKIYEQALQKMECPVDS